MSIIKAKDVVFVKKPVPVRVGKIPLDAPRRTPDAVRAEPEVTVAKSEDGVIQSVTVRCTCGREIPLQCEYLDGGDK